ncbi:uncharacterized protein LOC129295063 isoform X2 [Prosopis cineraria]|nr:uncharacterized protein LOC129295063 isoform X2 [Prosopis cineraria]
MLRWILNLPMSPEAFASKEICDMFMDRIFSNFGRKNDDAAKVVVEDDVAEVVVVDDVAEVVVDDGTGASDDNNGCPICLEEMMKTGKEVKLVACETCQSVVHERCFVEWKKTKENKASLTCVICRAPWKSNQNLDGSVIDFANV